MYVIDADGSVAAIDGKEKSPSLAGICVSACIEISQLIFLRGLFEWDDMIHNAFGCMVGCILCNMVVRRDNKIRKKNKAEGQKS